MRRIVVADIGGTHARFAVAEANDGEVRVGPATKMRAADHASLQTAWEAFQSAQDAPLPNEAALAIAAPIRGDVIKMTNSPWTLRPAELPRELGLERLTLINDFEAVAHAVDGAGEDELRRIAGPDVPLPDDGVISVVGPGTGLGVAFIVRADGRSHVRATEGGHLDFAPTDDIEDRILHRLRGQHGRVSVERVASGPGFRAILEVLADLEGRAVPEGSDAELWTLALAGDDSLAAAALDRFCRCLGGAAGDLALAHGPGAVVIAGGLGQRLADVLPASAFAERFAAKGRYRALMQGVPVKLITHAEPGLMGAARAFLREHPQ